MASFWLALRLLLLLAAANTAPLAAKRLLGDRWRLPLDGGRVFVDGRPLLGASKTVRGLLAALAATALLGPWLGFRLLDSVLVGGAAMLGDALASFVKRRLGIASSGRALGLDQLPEALLPLLFVQPRLQLTTSLVLVVALAFFALEIPLARLSQRAGLRDQPY